MHDIDLPVLRDRAYWKLWGSTGCLRKWIAHRSLYVKLSRLGYAGREEASSDDASERFLLGDVRFTEALEGEPAASMTTEGLVALDLGHDTASPRASR